MLSKDGVPVVLHDVQIDTVTDVARRFPDRRREDGRTYAIDFTLAELKTLAVHERVDPKTGEPVFPGRFPAGKGAFSIPTLDEELDLIAGLNASTGREVGIYPEIKAPAWHRAGAGRQRGCAGCARPAGVRRQGRSLLCAVLRFRRGEARSARSSATRVAWCSSWAGGAGRGSRTRRRPRGWPPWRSMPTGSGRRAAGGPDVAEGGVPEPTDLVRLAHAAGLEVHPYTVRVDALPAGVTAGDYFRALFEGAGSTGCSPTIRIGRSSTCGPAGGPGPADGPRGGGDGSLPATSSGFTPFLWPPSPMGVGLYSPTRSTSLFAGSGPPCRGTSSRRSTRRRRKSSSGSRRRGPSW